MREFRLSDIAAVLEIAKHPRFTGYLSFRQKHLEEDVSTYIQVAVNTQMQDKTQSRELFRLAICLSKNKSLIGCCVLDGWNRSFDDQVAFFIHPDHQGQGYATEAAQSLISEYWTQYPSRPVYATVDPVNRASQRVLEKLKFSQCGHKNIKLHGQTHKRIIYSTGLVKKVN